MIKEKGIRGFSLTLLATAIAATSIQTVTAAEQQQKEETVRVIEEVVVTARKREESLQDIPLAVTAIDSSQLDISGAVDISDIQSQIPSLTTYAARGSSNTLTSYIRGVGQSDPLYGFEPGVGLYLDDVYIARPQGALLEISNVERIEVLRGPQGTLYGRNSIGGAIKYVSKDIGSEPEGKIQVTAGSYGRKDISGTYATPLIEDELFARVSLLSNSHDGYGKNRYTGSALSDKQVLSGNFALQWEPSDDLSFRLSGDTTKDTSAPRGGQRMQVNTAEARVQAIQGGATPTGISLLGPTYTLSSLDAFATTNGLTNLPASKKRYDTNSGLKKPVNDTTTKGLSLIIDKMLNDEWDVKSITAYRKGNTDTTIDFDMGPLPIADVYAKYHDDQLTQEFQFNYDNGDDWQVVTGIYYIDAKAGAEGRNNLLLLSSNSDTIPAGSTALLSIYNGGKGEVKTTSASVYGEANWQFDEKWGLTFGGRFTWEKKEADIFSANYADDTYSALSPFIANVTEFKDDHTWKNFSPKVGLDYQFSDATLIYSTISQGFKSGGYNVRARADLDPTSTRPYDEETVTAFELGVKTSLTDYTTLNAAYFYSDYKDIQISVFKTINSQFFGDIQNAGRGVIQGLELELSTLLTDNWTVGGNAAYIDAKYKEYRDASGNNIASQQKFTNTPEFTATLNTIYDHSLGEHGNLMAYASYSYRSEVYPTTDLSEVLKQDGYGLVDASLTWRPYSGDWTVALEGKNLTDKEYRTSGYDTRSGYSHTIQGFYGAPRTYAMKVGYEF